MARAWFRSTLVDGLWVGCMHGQCVVGGGLARSIVRSSVLMLHGKPMIHIPGFLIRSIVLNSVLMLSRTGDVPGICSM